MTVKAQTFSAEQQKRVDIVWAYFKKNLDWPLWKALIRDHPDEFENLPQGYSNEVYVGKYVSVETATVVRIPEVWELLQPLPTLLRLAAQRFIDHSTSAEKLPSPNITHEDFFRIWPDRRQMGLAHKLFTMLPLGLGGGSSSQIPSEGSYGPDWFEHGCTYRALRYRSVQSLDEVLTIASSHGGVSVGANPPEQHQALLRAVFAYAVKHGSWPAEIPFARDHINLGYVPQLVDDLFGQDRVFVRSRFSGSQYSRICLQIWALPFIDPSGTFQELLTRIITTLAQFWKQSPPNEGTTSVSLADLSNVLKIPPLEIAPAVLLLEEEPWVSGGNHERFEGWSTTVSKEIWQYRSIKSWEEYMEARIKSLPPPLIDLVPQDKRPQSDFDATKLADLYGILNPITGLLPAYTTLSDATDGQPKSRSTPLKDSLPVLGGQRCDIAIICALRKPELEKVLSTGKKEEWEKLPSDPNDPQIYHRTTYTTSAGKKLRIIAAAMNQMGPPAAAALAAKIILRFRPRLMAMVGIAAGAKADSAGFGDILAPDITFDYTSGKVIDANGKSVFKPDYKPFHLDSRIVSLLKDWQAESRALYDIWRDWPGPKPQRPPHLIIGPLGSGSSVVANSAVVDNVETHWRKLVGIEMEAYAVHCACRNTLTPETPYIAFKAVCDFANNDKNDEWQPYAAYTAAEVFHRFIISEWENLHLEYSLSLPAEKSDE